MEHETETDSIFEAICEYSVTQSANASTFGKLLAVGRECIMSAAPPTDLHTAAMFAARCCDSERAYLRETLGPDEFDKLPKYSAGSKAGQVRTAGLLPKTYQHAKSTIYNALEAGVSLQDENGNPLGKSALEKAKREKGAASAGADDQEIGEKLIKMAEKAIKLIKTSEDSDTLFVGFIEILRSQYHA